ncbi:MAG: hypothetical protein V3W20_12605 [Candidatus Neomarinimicrobiota bacterium]
MIKFLGVEKPMEDIITLWFEGIKIDMNRKEAKKILESLHPFFVGEYIKKLKGKP